MNKYFFTVVFVAILLVSSQAMAVTKTWLSANGGNGTSWSRSQNWSPAGEPTSSDDVVIPTTPVNGTGFPILNVNANVKSLAIAAGASLTCASGNSLTVAGSVTGNGTVVGDVSTLTIGGDISVATFSVAGATVVLNGPSSQSVSGFSASNLTVNNAAGVTLNGTVNVSTILTLSNGVVNTGSNKISVTNGNKNAVVITNGSVNGEMQRLIRGGGIPPATGEFKFTSANTSIITDGTQPEQTVSITAYPGQSPIPAPVTGNAINRYYVVNGPGPLTATLRLAYEESELNGILEIDLTTFRHNGSSWIGEGGVVNMTNNFVELTGVSNWTNWTLGDNANPLPIQLMSFTASVLSASAVRLDWATLTETNNYGFEVQKSFEVLSGYETVANSFVPGHGTTLVPHYYSWTDETAQPGSWYYRLKQIDLDGTIHYTEGTQVDILTGVGDAATTPVVFALGQNFPNPFNPSTTIEFALSSSSYVTLNLYTLLGEEVASLAEGDFAAGNHAVRVDGAGLASGTYFYRIVVGDKVESRKLILMR